MGDCSIHVKPGVVFKLFNRYTLEFLNALLACAHKYSRTYTITSAHDGKHAVNSYHYRDHAWDVRMNDVPRSHRYVVVDFMRKALPGYFDVVLEEYPTNPDNDHLHIEADLSKIADAMIEVAE